MLLSLSSITCTGRRTGDVPLAGVTEGLAESNGSLPPRVDLKSYRGQLWSQRSVRSMATPYFFTCVNYHHHLMLLMLPLRLLLLALVASMVATVCRATRPLWRWSQAATRLLAAAAASSCRRSLSAVSRSCTGRRSTTTSRSFPGACRAIYALAPTSRELPTSRLMFMLGSHARALSY